MAVSLINIGNIANDGTGDDLREAFIKVNSNFEELDLRQPESTTASNLSSSGEGIFSNKVENDLQFKTLIAGSNITLSANSDTITVDAVGGLQSLSFSADSGNVVLADGDSFSIQGGALTSTSLNTSNNTLVIDSQTDLASDGSPRLSTNLDAQSFDIDNVGTVFGSLEGLVYGVDVRVLNTFFTDLDFGGLSGSITNWVDLIKSTYTVDLGSFATPSDFDIDLGTI